MRAAVAAWWSLAAAGLGVVALLARPGPNAAAAGASVLRLGLTPGQRATLERREPSGAIERIGFDPALDAPVWIRTRPTGGRDSWPVAPSRYAAGLRLLATAALEPRPAAAPTDDLGPGAVRLGITPDDAPERVLTLGSRALGGRAPALLDAQPVWISASLRDALATTGFAPWRETRLLLREGEDPRGVQLSAGGSTVVLERQGRRWFLAQPVRIEADDAAARSLVQLLRGVEATALDQGAAFDETLRFEGVATISTWGDATSAAAGTAAGTPAWRRTVAVRGALAGDAVQAAATWWTGTADPAAPSFAAPPASGSPGTQRHGPALARIPAAALTRLSADPLAYVRRAPSAAAEADIAALRITSVDGSRAVELRRAADGSWSIARDSATAATLAGVQADGASSLLTLLTRGPGEPAWATPRDDADSANPEFSAQAPSPEPTGVRIDLLAPRPTADPAAPSIILDTLRVRAEGTGLVIEASPSSADAATSAPTRRLRWLFPGPDAASSRAWLETLLMSD